GSELYGKTLGIIGIGRIGREVARRAIALGMKVISYDPYVDKIDMEGVELVDLDTLLSNSDFITLHIPHTDETHHIIGKDAFEKMKDGVYLINCARGGVVDEEALYEYMKSGKVKGAGFDVFEKEPPENLKLLELENFICTPHIGASTKEGQARVGEEIVKILKGMI
ncbi:3-phosphoglycerate dehydrogenase, partial [bacterium]